MKPKKVLEQYYRAWIENDREAARTFLCDDLKFRAPNDAFDSADEFLEACWEMAAGFNELNLLHEVYADESAFIAYKFGEYSVGELHYFRDGKIAEVYVTFNQTL